jgi:hypothetical protein
LLVVAERAADIADTLGNAVVGDKDARPDRVHDLFAVDDPPGVLHKMAQ